jgi:hypothetical protein
VKGKRSDPRAELTRRARIAADRIGCTAAEWLEKKAAGLKWCQFHKAWHPAGDFARDAARYDGLDFSCRQARSAQAKSRNRSRRKK